eukprot:TRINITY_DN797_c1_g1_i1.p1 TRINITY_DN797_c1_g1~~TRINITY_DN797_c1_g1_i1.p1  ORF type:complete len:198 (+),score=58.54 TRINITY_DN797_c1_g1_i1:38-631(+)
MKVIIVGDAAVGKTTLCRAITQNFDEFQDSYELNYKTNNKKEINLVFHDTVGQDDFSQFNVTELYETADLFFVCYSIISPKSLQNIEKKWITNIRALNDQSPVVLIGTKSDLREDEDIIERLNQRDLSPLKIKDGKTTAKNIEAAEFFEASFFDDEDNDLILDQIFEKICKSGLSPEQYYSKKNLKNKKKINDCNLV